MHVDKTTMLLAQNPSLNDVRDLLQSCTRTNADVRYQQSGSTNSDGATDYVGVFTRALSGKASLELDVHWHGHTLLGHDAVAFRLSKLIDDAVIVRNYDEHPTRWLLVTAGSEELFQNVIVDEIRLNEGVLQFKMM